MYLTAKNLKRSVTGCFLFFSTVALVLFACGGFFCCSCIVFCLDFFLVRSKVCLFCSKIIVFLHLTYRYSGWDQTVFTGVDIHHPEGSAVPVLEDESSGGSCHGINCQADRLPCTTTSGNGALCTAARPAGENLDWEGKEGTVTSWFAVSPAVCSP